MKNILIYLFLVTYSTVMLKPVLPYIADAIAHVLFFKDHMQKVHAHQGKLHAHVAVAEGAKNDQSEKSSNNLKKDNGGTDHFINEICSLSVHQIRENYFYSISIPLITRDINHNYPPPRV